MNFTHASCIYTGITNINRVQKMSYPGLIDASNDPSVRVLKSEVGVVIKDKYPKARFHFLVLPFVNISSIYHLEKQHLELLNEMTLLATNVIELHASHGANFKVGFHLSPSMEQLHLHVLSDDFVSSCLTNKKHWNSFNTELFLTPESANFGNLHLNHWSKQLVHDLNIPELQILRSKRAAVLRDKYPKSTHHFLVLPFEDIPSIFDLRKRHLNLLTELKRLATNIIKKQKLMETNFMVGYHLSPSMERVHLHVISDDFISQRMKNRGHWNGFHTDNFLSPEYVYDTIQKDGKLVKPPREVIRALEATPLKCHKCSFEPKNIPTLKKHLETHCN